MRSSINFIAKLQCAILLTKIVRDRFGKIQLNKHKFVTQNENSHKVQGIWKCMNANQELV